MFAPLRNLKLLTGAELLLLRLAAGPVLAAVIAWELDRRASSIWRSGLQARRARGRRTRRAA